MLTQLTLSNIRNVSKMTLEPSSGVNLIVGASGAGKSTMLEAMHLLSTGASHRGRRYASIVRSGERELTVSGVVSSKSIMRRIGVSRDSQSKWKLSIDREPQSRLAALAGMFPLRVISADSWRVVVGEPELRRNLIDWFLFHVEQEQYPLFQYRRLLQQRNAALQQEASNRVIDAIDQNLIPTAEEVHRYRTQLVATMNCILFDQPTTTMTYKSGFGDSLYHAFEKSRGTDRKLRTTTRGPHRADLLISCYNRPAKEVLSQGQIARVATTLQLRLISLMENVAVCLDDVHAFLDEEALEGLISQIGSRQIFVTETRESSSFLKDHAQKLFHVEHGELL
ncbi:MAG: DNA replication and repair protein RecF [Gammaproteobacteria bacterium]|nr:DNA replication and repair protein RecF [Gammaproteobacteria bacterium]